MENNLSRRDDGRGSADSGVLSGPISFYAAPDTMCLANFQLSLWDERMPRFFQPAGPSAAEYAAPLVVVRKNLDLVWVWFYKEVALRALKILLKTYA